MKQLNTYIYPLILRFFFYHIGHYPGNVVLAGRMELQYTCGVILDFKMASDFILCCQQNGVSEFLI